MEPSISSQIRRMRKLEIPLSPPASHDQLLRLKAILGGHLIQQIVSLYTDHNGSDGGKLEYRLLSVDEVAEAMKFWGEVEEIKPFKWVPLWTNDNSDWVGIHTGGPLKGIITFLDHDYIPFYPGFRSVERFYSKLIDCYESRPGEDDGEEIEVIRINLPVSEEELRNICHKGRESEFGDQEWELQDDSENDMMYSRQKDFGKRPFLPTKEFVENDRERVKGLWEIFRRTDDEMRQHCCTFLVALTPRADSAELLPLLDDDDFYVASEAARSLGARRFMPAYPKLKHLAVHGFSNAHSAALYALRFFPGPETLNYTIEIMKDPVFKDFPPHDFMHLLIVNGCEVQYTKTPAGRENLRYRLPNGGEWIPVRIGKG